MWRLVRLEIFFLHCFCLSVLSVSCCVGLPLHLSLGILFISLHTPTHALTHTHTNKSLDTCIFDSCLRIINNVVFIYLFVCIWGWQKWEVCVLVFLCETGVCESMKVLLYYYSNAVCWKLLLFLQWMYMLSLEHTVYICVFEEKIKLVIWWRSCIFSHVWKLKVNCRLYVSCLMSHCDCWRCKMVSVERNPLLLDF